MYDGDMYVDDGGASPSNDTDVGDTNVNSGDDRQSGRS